MLYIAKKDFVYRDWASLTLFSIEVIKVRFICSLLVTLLKQTAYFKPFLNLCY